MLAFDNEHALTLGGFEVVATVDRMRDAEAVIESEGGVDLLIADIRLRGVRSGIDLAVHARARDIAVLFVTGSCPTEAQIGGIALGWLAKPFAPRDLVRSVNICDRVIRDLAPGRLPPGLTLFPFGA